MAVKRPVFLFAFANDAQSSLRLGEELNATENALSKLHDEQKLQYISAGYPTLEDLYNRFDRFDNRIWLFHFGGHSDVKGLQLMDTFGQSESLATILGRQERLQLVFLNGCANREQVEKLWEKGVKAVIATSAKVSDSRALILADRFYQALASGQTIQQAFDTAVSFVKNDHELSVNCVFRGQGIDLKETEKEFPWGIYVQDKKVLDWHIGLLEQVDNLELLDALRIASQKLYNAFTGKGGRFQFLQIEEVLLAGISNKSHTKVRKLLEMTIGNSEIPMEASLERLWQENCQHAFIVGAGGMGKTVSLIQFWEYFLNNPENHLPVPIFIPLNEFNNRPEIKFIRNYIKEHYRCENIDQLLREPLRKEGIPDRPHLILLLDGFNEVTTISNNLLLEINDLKTVDKYPGVQIVITSRVDIRKTYQWHAFHLLELQLLTDEQIGFFLKKNLPTDYRLLDLLRNPMMLSIYAAQTELPQRYFDKDLLKENVSSTGEMLYNVEAVQRIKIEEQFAVKPTEQAYRRFVLEHLVPFIGWKMQQAGLFFLPRESASEKVPALKNLLNRGIISLLNDDFFETFEFFAEFLEEDKFQESPQKLFIKIIKRIAGNELVILVKDGDNYRFLHQNFRDYFAARHVQNQIDIALKRKYLPDIVQKAPLDFYVRRLLGELEGEHKNLLRWNIEDNRWHWSEGQFFLQNKLTRLLEQCRGVFKSERLGYIIWNLLMIWHEVRGELSGADLSQLDFSHVRLNRLKFSRQGLTANFSEGKINRQNLLSQGHSNRVVQAVFSPTGEYIASGSADHTIILWDSRTGQNLRQIKVKERITALAFDSQGAQLVSGTAEGNVDVWDLQTGENVFRKSLYGVSVYSVSFDPCKKDVIAIGSYNETILLWNIQMDQKVLELVGHTHRVESVYYNTDGSKIISCSGDQTAKIWDSENGECLLTLDGHESLVTCAAMNPTEEIIVTGSWDRKIKIWEVETGQNKKTINAHQDDILGLTFNLDGTKIISSSSDGTIKIWDFQSETELLEISELYGMNNIDLSTDGINIVCGCDDGTSKVFDINTGAKTLILDNRYSSVLSTDFSGNGKKLITGSSDRSVKIWDLENMCCIGILEGHIGPIFSVAFHPNEEQLISGSLDGLVKIWDLKNNICLFNLEGHKEGILSVAYNWDGSQIVSGSLDKTVKIWDSKTGECFHTLKGHVHEVNSVAFSLSGEKIISGSGDKTIMEWNAKNGNLIRVINGHKASITEVIYLYLGVVSASGSLDDTAKVWNMVTGNCILTLSGHSDDVLCVAFNRQEKQIITGSKDNSLKIWDIHTGKCLYTLVHNDEIRSVKCSPDGKYIVTGSNNTVKVWNAKSGTLIFNLINEPGLLIQGCDFRILEKDSEISEEEISTLRMYGAVFNDEDKGIWLRSMK